MTAMFFTTASLMDLAHSLSMEMIIFAVTFAFAFLIKGLSVSKVPAKKSGNGKCRGGSGTSASRTQECNMYKSSTTNVGCHQRYPCDRLVDRYHAAEGFNSGINPHSSLRLSGQSSSIEADTTNTRLLNYHGRRSFSAQHKTPWHVVDEIMDGMREQQNIKFASKALVLYEELKAGLREDGVSMLDITRHSKHPAIDFYTILVHCAIRAGRFGLIGSIIDDMVTYGVNRPLIFYESTMKQLAGQKQYRLALSVYDHLHADGLVPSAVTYSCLIGFAAEVGELSRAVEFFNRLKVIATPNIRACMMVLRVHSKRQDWQTSVATLQEMQRQGVSVDSLALNVVLATGIAVDQVEQVGDLIVEMDAYKRPISDVVSFNTLIKGYAQRSDVDGTHMALGRMKARGLVPNAITYNTLMDAAVRSGKYKEAWDSLAQMRAAGLSPDKFTCSILVKGLVKNANYKQVQDVLDVLNEVDSACDASLRSTLYHAILEAAAQVTDGNGSAALTAKAFAQMRRQRVQPAAFAQQFLVQATREKQSVDLAK